MIVRRYPQLAHWGAFTAVVEDGRLIACEPFAADPDPSPLLDAIVPMVYSPTRIRAPMVRRGWLARRESSDGHARGRDDFVEVSWDDALDLVAGEIARVRGTYGPSGVFGGSYGWSSAGRLHHARSLIRRFHFTGGGCVDQVGNYSWGTAQFLLPHVIGTYQPLTGRVTAWPSLIAHTEVFLAFGGLALKNGQVSSGGAAEHTQAQWLRKLAASGATVINVSPTRDDCPDFLGAEWVPIRPNTDVALMLALAYALRRADAHDAAFLQSHCSGWAELEAYLLGDSDGTPKTPAWAAAITGIPAARIERLAAQLAGRRSYITCSFAVQRQHRGEQPYWMAIALAAMLGQIGLPGGGFGFGHGSMNGVGNPRVATPGPEMPVGRNPADLDIPCARLADMLLHPGTPYRFQGETRHYPDVKLVHWAGGNPFHHHQQLARLRQAWARPQTVIVQDIVWTATARHADIVLPVTTALERNDIGGSSRDRYVLAMHRAIAPLHQARSDLDIFTGLAERLGYRDAFTERRDEPGWIEAIYARCREAQARAGIDLPDFDTFWRAGHVALPPPAEDFVLFDDFRRDPLAHPLRTRSGRIELSSATLGRLSDDCGTHPNWQPPAEWLGAPEAQRHPLHLVSVQPADRLHSQLDAAPLAQSGKVAGAERITLHPADAAARGLTPGMRVRVHNTRGAIAAGLAVSDGITRGVAMIATGAWYNPDADGLDRAGAANTLTLDIGTSDLTQGPNAMSCLVEVSGEG
ncbi:molybdopterin-dependent oxidoreductase [Cupriavidus pauculus]|uniref:Asp-tRNA(Asn)/Glu-tRNA(Gln) amidotransferase GatCAB subunit C n=1 Tax=Cupriavidus pauculus TaxID=82633 RepID=A0A3G8H7E3_9BURK|nr:molybdopterin-dependent oxidoreductase [Cupriavidus pauculus]AZG16493.1 Asp-tRNA(Asn)/Glu-tRNA(Gln) amidotransferase GatCAB subunit C [Cupriavidus pauculus]